MFSFFQKKRRSKIAENWFALDEKVRFLVTGLFNTAVRYTVFVLVTLWLTPARYQVNLLLSWMLSSVPAFLIYKHLVFETAGNHLKEYLKSVLTWVVSYVLNAVILEILAGRLMWNVYLAQAVAVIVITVNNYLLFKHFAFKRKKVSVWEKWLSIFK